ncbi:ATP-binding cassette domain-containing protein, partial [Enterobacter roggenkampii]
KERTVFDNEANPLKNAAASYDDNLRRVSQALEKVGLQDKPNNIPIQLSAGQQQLLGIAPALLNKHAVLLTQEPTANQHEDHKERK